MRETATTQHPQPPSPHILLVPVNPGWDRSHELRLREGGGPCTSTGSPFRVKETEVLGSMAGWAGLFTAFPMVAVAAEGELEKGLRYVMSCVQSTFDIRYDFAWLPTHTRIGSANFMTITF